MATHGDLTVGKLRHYLSAYEDDTRVVLGKEGTSEVHWDCHANSYYPLGHEEQWPLVVIDIGNNLLVPPLSEPTGDSTGLLAAGIPSPEFAVYEDYDGKLHIVDGATRVVLSDNFAYDTGNSAEMRKLAALHRMELIAQAMNNGWPVCG